MSDDKLINFVEQFLLPYYSTFNNSSVELGVRQIGGSTLFVTEKYVSALKGSLTVQDIIGSTPAQNNDVCSTEISKFCRRLDQQMIASPAVQEFVILGVRNDGALNRGINTPLFAPDGHCFGFQFMYEPCAVSGELLERQITLFNTKTLALQNVYEVKLDEREERLLSFLILGYTQAQIASIFKCSRSFISKLIMENLCPKFGVAGYSARVLVDKAISLGYANFIPKSLLQNLSIRVSNIIAI